MASPLGIDTAAGDADIAQQQLQHCSGPHILGPVGGLGDAHGVQDVARLVRGAGSAISAGDQFEVFAAAAHNLAHCFSIVPGIVVFKHLKDATGMLQRRIFAGIALGVQLIAPGVPVIAAFGIAGKDSVGKEITGIENVRGISIVDNIFPLVEFLFDGIVY